MATAAAADTKRRWALIAGAALLVAGIMAILSALATPTESAFAVPASVQANETASLPAVPEWRNAFLVTGGICLAAGLGLVALALMPRDAPRT